MNVVKTSQLSIVEFLKYVSDGKEHLDHIVERKKSNCQKTRTQFWITKYSKRNTSLPWRRSDNFRENVLRMSTDNSPRRIG